MAMADGIITNDETALVPVTLATARASLPAHPLSLRPTALQVVDFDDLRPANYAADLATAGLGWRVAKTPLYSSDGQVWPAAFGIRREDTGARLGVVGPQYTPLQNSDLGKALDLAFGFMPARLRPRVVNVGALGAGAGMGVGNKATEGARVFAQLTLPNELSDLLRVPQDRDSDTHAFLTLTNTHDGSSTAAIGASAVRIVCRNTWQMAHAQSKANGGLSLKHTVRNVKTYQEQVGKWFRAIGQGYQTQGQRMRAYASKPMNVAAVNNAVSTILFGEVIEEPRQTRQQKEKVAAILDMVEGRDGAFVPVGDVTAYSVLQAATAYDMHRRPARGELEAQTSTRLWRVLAGSDSVIPAAFATLDALIAN